MCSCMGHASVKNVTTGESMGYSSVKPMRSVNLSPAYKDPGGPSKETCHTSPGTMTSSFKAGSASFWNCSIAYQQCRRG